MSILLDRSSRIVIQGAAGVEGMFHTEQMLSYGSRVVAGVDPSLKTDNIAGVPAYKLLKEAISNHSPDTSIIFVPAPFAFDAIMEAIYCGIKTIIVITEGIPITDFLKIKQYSRDRDVCIIGPNCPGVIVPEECKAGIMPGHIFKKGEVGVISRSGTLTYEIVLALSSSGIGQSTCVGIGGDPVPGSSFIDILKKFKDDEQTRVVVLIGEIGGSAEEMAAEYIRSEFGKPVVAFIAGKSAPPGKTMGHAGAIISAGVGTAEEKIEALERAGVKTASVPDRIPELVREYL
ncbi:MAG: succinate--CoA ligase subunit alpha [Spirochaetes bacterium]|nr:MAG: succinate--CoA ligase subunit alpha [Spirochaetota bacterium]